MADKYLKIRIDEETLLQLQEVAKRSRRDTHSHVLWLIDQELGGDITKVEWNPSNPPSFRIHPSRIYGGGVYDERTGKFVAYNDFHKE